LLAGVSSYFQNGRKFFDADFDTDADTDNTGSIIADFGVVLPVSGRGSVSKDFP
jgi:hypothetical protein